MHVIAYSTQPADLLNDWVVEVDGVRRGRFIGSHAVYAAARLANKYRLEPNQTSDKEH